jgi:hypothetical protein
MEVSGEIQAPAALPPEKNHSANWIGALVDPRVGLDGFGVEEVSGLYKDSNLSS